MGGDREGGDYIFCINFAVFCFDCIFLDMLITVQFIIPLYLG